MQKLLVGICFSSNLIGGLGIFHSPKILSVNSSIIEL